MPSQTHTEANRLIIYAPGIHTGGGFTLLKAILDSRFIQSNPTLLFLDLRCLTDISLPESAKLVKIAPSLLGRLKAERQLASICQKNDTVICLHSLPPLFRMPGRTVCLLQNILHLGRFPLRDYPGKVRIRLMIESNIAAALKSRVDTYFVQTSSMKQALLTWHKGTPQIVICPFVPDQPKIGSTRQHRWNTGFIYVADGLTHKNHRNLIKAWTLLAEEGIHPKLTLTLSERDTDLLAHLEMMQKQHGLEVENIGHLPQEGIDELYRTARALIFPSYAESLGLPLIEASQRGLPILASELDYVRDVCHPAETFDPSSPLSIARAIKRFLSIGGNAPKLYSADTFLLSALSPGASAPMEAST